MKVFGPGIWSDDLEQVEVPVGMPCAACGMKIKKRDRGAMIPLVLTGTVLDQPWHVRCLLESVIMVRSSDDEPSTS